MLSTASTVELDVYKRQTEECAGYLKTPQDLVRTCFKVVSKSTKPPEWGNHHNAESRRSAPLFAPRTLLPGCCQMSWRPLVGRVAQALHMLHQDGKLD